MIAIINPVCVFTLQSAKCMIQLVTCQDMIFDVGFMEGL